MSHRYCDRLYELFRDRQHAFQRHYKKKHFNGWKPINTTVTTVSVSSPHQRQLFFGVFKLTSLSFCSPLRSSKIEERGHARACERCSCENKA